MNFYFLTLLLVIFTMLSPSLFALDMKGDHLLLGYGSYSTGQFRVNSTIDHHSTNAAHTPFFYIYYENDNFEINGWEARYSFKLAQKIKMGPILKFWGDQYETTGVSEREIALFAGGFAQYGHLNAFYVRDVFNKSQGGYAEISLHKNYKIKRFLYLNYRLAYEVYDSNYTNYYYGITDQEATRSPLAAFSTGAGESYYLSAGALMFLPWRLVAYLNIGHRFLSQEISNSPTVDKDNYFFMTTFLAYRFY